MSDCFVERAADASLAKYRCALWTKHSLTLHVGGNRVDEAKTRLFNREGFLRVLKTKRFGFRRKRTLASRANEFANAAVFARNACNDGIAEFVVTQ